MQGGGDLKSVFLSYTGGKPGMESKPFMKVFKDINLFQGKPPLVTNDVDIIFSKYKGKGLKSITFADFEAALGDVAAKKK